MDILKEIQVLNHQIGQRKPCKGDNRFLIVQIATILEELSKEQESLIIAIDGLNTGLTNHHQDNDRHLHKPTIPEEELKPCPFCKATGESIEMEHNTNRSRYFRRCAACKAEGPIGYDEFSADSNWNRRSNV